MSGTLSGRTVDAVPIDGADIGDGPFQARAADTFTVAMERETNMVGPDFDLITISPGRLPP